MSIYMLSDGTGFYKIGSTSRPIMQRVAELQTGNPRKLDVVLRLSMDDMASLLVEKAIHAWLAEHAAPGGEEWFELSREKFNLVVFAMMSTVGNCDSPFVKDFLVPSMVSELEKSLAAIGANGRFDGELNAIREFAR